MNTHFTKITLALLLSAATALAGDDVTTKHTLTLDGAKKAADAAVAYAKANGAPGSAIAVVDDGGHLLYFIRLDGTFTASPNISIGKAKTAPLFKKPTSDFENIINKGRFAMAALPKSAAQDEEVAKAGAAAVEETKTAAN